MPAITTSSRSGRVVTIVLFVVYAVLLVAIVLLKFPFNYLGEHNPRVLNLIPFADISGRGGHGWTDVVENILAFVPLGIYLGMLKPRWSFARTLVVIIAASVVFEVIQYVFAIGRSDITDVIDNSLGGVLGIAVFDIVTRILKRRTRLVLNIVGAVVTVVMLVFFLWLFGHSISAP
jgi:glycopeptide antibiotics resistance protein